MRMDISADRLRELLSYDAESGVFRWLVNRKKVRAGDIAGAYKRCGYSQICVDQKQYSSHRIAWLYVYGVMPVWQIDHIDGCRDNNRISNLRQCTQSENMQNQAIHINSTSGRVGVSWHKPGHKWSASIRVSGKRRHLGLFASIDDAASAYVKAKAELHSFCPAVRSA